MDAFILEAETRLLTSSPRRLRCEQKIPAVFYGKGEETLHLNLPYKMFSSLYKKAGENNLVDLHVDGGKKKYKVLVHTVQIHPVTDEIIHADLINVRMDHRITTHIRVRVVGVAPAVKDFSGILSVQCPEIEIRCLPADLIHEIQVDVSSLKHLRDCVKMRDLNFPPMIEVLTDKDRTIATVLAPKKEEEVVAAPTAIETAAAESAAAAAALAEGGETAVEPGKGEKKAVEPGKIEKVEKSDKKKKKEKEKEKKK